MKIKQEDIRDSIIYLFRYCLYRNTYAVSTAQEIIRYNLHDFSNHDIKLFIREIVEAFDEYADSKYAGIDKSWMQTKDLLKDELFRRDNES